MSFDRVTPRAVRARRRACLGLCGPFRGSLLGGGAFAVAAFAALPGCYGADEIEQPIALHGVESIEYPIELWDEGVEGSTLLRVRITLEGVVDSVVVAESSGYAALDSAAVKGARALAFQPGRRNGERVRMWATLPIFFSKPRP